MSKGFKITLLIILAIVLVFGYLFYKVNYSQKEVWDGTDPDFSLMTKEEDSLKIICSESSSIQFFSPVNGQRIQSSSSFEINWKNCNLEPHDSIGLFLVGLEGQTTDNADDDSPMSFNIASSTVESNHVILSDISYLPKGKYKLVVFKWLNANTSNATLMEISSNQPEVILE